MVRRARKPDPRETVELRAGRRCEYCRAPQPATGIRYHLEHVFPESLGGSDDVDNPALVCPTVITTTQASPRCRRRRGGGSAAIQSTEGPVARTFRVRCFDPPTQRKDKHG